MPKSKETITSSDDGDSSDGERTEKKQKREKKEKAQSSDESGSSGGKDVSANKRKITKREKDKKAESSEESDSSSDGASKRKRKSEKKLEKSRPSKKSKKSTQDEEEPMWEIAKSRFVTVRKFKGTLLIDIREKYPEKNTGKLMPGRKGISLDAAQWKKLMECSDEVNKAIKDLA